MTVTVLNKQQRSGESATGSVTVPPTPPASLIATILITLADMQDLAVRITLRAEVSSNAGTTWMTIGAGTWEGGPQDQKHGITPEWRLMIEGLQNHTGKLLRGVLGVEPQTSVGLSVTV